MDEVSDSHNLVEHFINSTGLISYDFFKNDPDYEFVAWNHDSDTQSEFEYLSELIHKEGRDIYIADYEHMGIYACRVIVPGMSEIYPIQDLEWSNNNEGALLRKAILSLKEMDEDELQELSDDLEYGSAPDTQKVAELIGIAPDKETLWETLQVGELKAMVCFALQDLEGAKEWNSWSLEMEQVDEKRTRLYRCLDALLEIELDEERELHEYETSLKLIFGDKNFQICSAIMQAKEVFHGLHSPGLSLDGFKEHKKLLNAYMKVHKAKNERRVVNK
jgi:ribosomal protein S12 methylthiotransferase accessory factor